MTTITQNGYDFIYRTKLTGQQPILESWSIERVAAFVFLVEFYRQRSQRYVGSFTFVSRVGSIPYELLEFDRETNRDVDKLTKLLLPYTSDELCVMWYTSLPEALDMAEKLLRERVSREEEDVVVFGGQTVKQRFLERPTREEYESRFKADFEGILPDIQPDQVMLIKFDDLGIVPCIKIRETPRYIFVDGFLKGKQVVFGSRVGKGSARIVKE